MPEEHDQVGATELLKLRARCRAKPRPSLPRARLREDQRNARAAGARQSLSFERAVDDYLPSRDTEMLEYMELLAVFEASNRRMLPPKYASLSVEELQERVQLLRLKVGSRR